MKQKYGKRFQEKSNLFFYNKEFESFKPNILKRQKHCPWNISQASCVTCFFYAHHGQKNSTPNLEFKANFSSISLLFLSFIRESEKLINYLHFYNKVFF
jgi:hypothetical protein